MAALVTPPGLMPPHAAALGQPVERVAAYWRSLGLCDPGRLYAGARQLLERLEADHPGASEQELSELALRRAAQLVSNWLADIRRNSSPAAATDEGVLLAQIRVFLRHCPDAFLHPDAADLLRNELHSLSLAPQQQLAVMPVQTLAPRKPEPDLRPALLPEGAAQP